MVVIGAGLAGLAAGIRCSQFFKRVLVLEAHSKTGGLNSYYHKQSRQHLFCSGLHTVTNYQSGTRKWGLANALRNLGIPKEALQLRAPTCLSKISLPGLTLPFGNNEAVLEQAIAERFPSQIDGYRRFRLAVIPESLLETATSPDYRSFLSSFIDSYELRQALALPVLTYGAHLETPIDSRLFAIIFRSLLIEGCASPTDVKVILDVLQARLRELGGVLLGRAPVVSLQVEQGRARRAVLADGRCVEAEHFISSAGFHETGRLCGLSWGRPGAISVYQWMGAYDRPLPEIGVTDSLHFASTNLHYTWRIPGDRIYTEVLTFSAGDAYAFEKPGPAHFKVSIFSRMEEWRDLSPEAYLAQKARYNEAILQASEAFYPGFRRFTPLVEDCFSPKTLERYTGHPGGTVYGGLDKCWDGASPLPNVHIAGNDQGGLGIVGAMSSGVLVSNYRVVLTKA